MLLPSTVRPLVGAHRGASADAPENTLAAFDLAVEQGAERIEFDVHRTRNGDLVVLHDFSPRRTANGAGTVAELTLTELKALDAGAWRGPRWAGQRIPTLAEVLDRYGERVYLNVEIKVDQTPYRGIEDEVAAAIRERGLYDRIVVSSFDFATVGRLRQVDPQVRAALLAQERPDEALRVAAEIGAVGVHLMSALIVRDNVARAAERGLGILAWTVDTEPEIKRLLALDIDAIVSNVPALLRRVVMDYRQGR
ncbi:MAG: glycerophosphodiester phosphodiesterase [Chloroflexota bacterium]